MALLGIGELDGPGMGVVKFRLGGFIWCVEGKGRGGRGWVGWE